nr:hypothetical protein [uncultured Mediterraneibacter sp.]
MEGLTFGEQVKIVLGRKGMTIKELAETIERETGMKMSRQNLTQRLGRDNFQEQDMRMIARILGCPFQLSILSDGQEAEDTSAQLYKTEVKHTSKHKESADEGQMELNFEAMTEGEQEEYLNVAETVAETVDYTVKTVADEASEEATISASETAEEVSEEKRAKAEDENAVEYTAEPQTDAAEEDVVEAENTVDTVETEAQEESVKESEIQVAEVNLSGPERDMTIGEMYDLHQELTELEEHAKEGESVEELKEELEKPRKEKFSPMNFFNRIRHSEKKAETPSWQSESDTDAKTEEPKDEVKAAEEPAVQKETSFSNLYVEDPQDEQLSMNFLYEEPQSAELEAEEMDSEAQETENQILTEQNAAEEYETDASAFAPETEAHTEETEASGQNEYAAQEEYEEQTAYAEPEEAELYEEEQEEEPVQEEVVGDVNPYTGKEYQSNSVRMHPTRIGYVQVYDQTIHKWTDMTEWAFLGYQERKKVLLGKAYEPPIYLD